MIYMFQGIHCDHVSGLKHVGVRESNDLQDLGHASWFTSTRVQFPTSISAPQQA